MSARPSRWWIVEIIAALLFVAAILSFVKFGGPIVARLASPPASTPPAIAACRIPSEHESVHIVVHQRGEHLVAECMHLGSRGTYLRPRTLRRSGA